MAEEREEPKINEKTCREQRLAATLRDNLRRRKAQARGRARTGDEEQPEPQAEVDV